MVAKNKVTIVDLRSRAASEGSIRSKRSTSHKVRSSNRTNIQPAATIPPALRSQRRPRRVDGCVRVVIVGCARVQASGGSTGVCGCVRECRVVGCACSGDGSTGLRASCCRVSRGDGSTGRLVSASVVWIGCGRSCRVRVGGRQPAEVARVDGCVRARVPVTSLRVCVSVTMDERPLRKYPVKLHLPDPATLKIRVLLVASILVRRPPGLSSAFSRWVRRSTRHPTAARACRSHRVVRYRARAAASPTVRVRRCAGLRLRPCYRIRLRSAPRKFFRGWRRPTRSRCAT
jgi:hypothetical protein